MGCVHETCNIISHGVKGFKWQTLV